MQELSVVFVVVEFVFVEELLNCRDMGIQMMFFESLKNLICIMLGFIVLLFGYNIFVGIWVYLFGVIFVVVDLFEF